MANSSNPTETDDENLVTCPICWQSYNESRMPKLLTSCGHTICAECAEPLTSELSIITCPICRRETDVSNNPLLTNFQLYQVILAKNEANAKKVNKTVAICKECESQITVQKGRCCETCDEWVSDPMIITKITKNVLCLVCCVEKHNGHNLVSLSKIYVERCRGLSHRIEVSKNSMALLRTDIETQHNDISLRLANILSQVQAYSQSYEQQFLTFISNKSSVDAKIDFEQLMEKQTFLRTLFTSAESSLQAVAELNSKILTLETIAVMEMTTALCARMTGSAMKRLMAEYRQLALNPLEGIIAGPISDENFFEWKCLISGPDNTCFGNGVFPAKIIFPTNYPLSPPTMQFLCDLFHPNIYPDGRMCISILQTPGENPREFQSTAEHWSPIQSVEKILLSVISMLAEPNDENAANVNAATMWREDRKQFEEIADRLVHKTLGIPLTATPSH